MGEVWRATDTRLGRDVALKLLPAAFASDPDRLARFEREAKVLASLNHPGIAHLYGFESVTLEDGTKAHLLVMELAEGEDLAERLKRGPLPVDEAVVVARQIAEALEEAHDKGIVHRDLKPANVKLTPDGKVKVLDFGLAKAWEGPGAASVRPVAVADPRPHRHRGRRHPRHRRLHVAGAGPREGGRPARRHLGVRRRALRDADRPEALRGRDGERRARRGPDPRAAVGEPARRDPGAVRRLLGAASSATRSCACATSGRRGSACSPSGSPRHRLRRRRLSARAEAPAGGPVAAGRRPRRARLHSPRRQARRHARPGDGALLLRRAGRASTGGTPFARRPPGRLQPGVLVRERHPHPAAREPRAAAPPGHEPIGRVLLVAGRREIASLQEGRLAAVDVGTGVARTITTLPDAPACGAGPGAATASSSSRSTARSTG